MTIHQSGESVFKLGAAQRDEFGMLQDRPIIEEIRHCVVSPAGDQVINGDGYLRGDVTKYQILAPAGTVFRDGDVVQVRGEEFTVDAIMSFDYRIGRRPMLARHRPKVTITVSRGEVSDGL